MKGYEIIARLEDGKPHYEFLGIMHFSDHKFPSKRIYSTPSQFAFSPDHLDSVHKKHGMLLSLSQLLKKYPPQIIEIDINDVSIPFEEQMANLCQRFFLTPIGCFRLKLSTDQRLNFAHDEDLRAVENEDETTKPKKSCCPAVSQAALKLSGLFPCLSSKNKASQTADKQSPPSSPIGPNGSDTGPNLRRRTPSTT